MKLLSSILISFILIGAASAHSNILYDVSLEFDPQLKEDITSTAQNYVQLNENPQFFDYDRELITVKFDRTLEYSVTINPNTMTVHGERDDSKTKAQGTTTKEQRKNAAETIFDQIPESYQKELQYGEEKKLYQGTYQHTWYRYIDGVYVANDQLEVEVNSAGRIVAWRLSPFFYRATGMTTTPSFSSDVAKSIAEMKFNGKLLEFSPILVIYGQKPVWVVKIKTLYPIFVGVNALDGTILFTGGLRTDLPENYAVSKQPIPTPFIQEVLTS